MGCSYTSDSSRCLHRHVIGRPLPLLMKLLQWQGNVYKLCKDTNEWAPSYCSDMSSPSTVYFYYKCFSSKAQAYGIHTCTNSSIVTHYQNPFCSLRRNVPIHGLHSLPYFTRWKSEMVKDTSRKWTRSLTVLEHSVSFVHLSRKQKF